MFIASRLNRRRTRCLKQPESSAGSGTNSASGPTNTRGVVPEVARDASVSRERLLNPTRVVNPRMSRLKGPLGEIQTLHLSILSAYRRNLSRSERLRFTQRVLDVLGLEDALCLEPNPKTVSGTAASLRGGTFGGRCRCHCDRCSPHGPATGSAIHTLARADLSGRW